MLDRIDHVIDAIFKSKGDKKTLLMSIGCLVAFGVSVGAVAVYERILRELDKESGYTRDHAHINTNSPFRRYDEEDY